MDELEEFESWHEDLMAWERFQDELERINGENAYADRNDFDEKRFPLQQASLHTIRRSNNGR